jgi:hypothetical protein
MNSPVNLFLDLIELETVTAKGNFDSLLVCLQSVRLTESYLISVACGGAARMFGCHSGVKKLFTERFPSLIVWHCTNHRLELSVSDTVKTVSGINKQVQIFHRQAVCLISCVPQNSRELHICAKLLEVELLKTGRI